MPRCCCIVPTSMWRCVTGQCNDGRVSERHPSSQLSTHWWVPYHKRTLRSNRKPETLKHARKTRWFSHQYRKDKAAQTRMNSRAYAKHQVVENARNKKWIWMKYSPTGIYLWLFCLRRGRSGVPELDRHFRCYPNQELLFRATSDLWRPRIPFKSVLGDPLPSAGLSHDSAWMFNVWLNPN